MEGCLGLAISLCPSFSRSPGSKPYVHPLDVTEMQVLTADAARRLANFTVCTDGFKHFKHTGMVTGGEVDALFGNSFFRTECVYFACVPFVPLHPPSLCSSSPPPSLPFTPTGQVQCQVACSSPMPLDFGAPCALVLHPRAHPHRATLCSNLVLQPSPSATLRACRRGR
ncbi:hypothetical protein C8R47DRAFT_1085515 [Mycena vitilis]|nr:hypothetical protein C8R47DRAFT_1085515 [Mycena vitilis]